jgi:hypothetical protein
MTDTVKKCAMEGCTCIPAGGKKYCSEVCEDSKNITTLECPCQHAACTGNKL